MMWADWSDNCSHIRQDMSGLLQRLLQRCPRLDCREDSCCDTRSFWNNRTHAVIPQSNNQPGPRICSSSEATRLRGLCLPNQGCDAAVADGHLATNFHRHLTCPVGKKSAVAARHPDVGLYMGSRYPIHWRFSQKLKTLGGDGSQELGYFPGVEGD